MQLQMTAPLDIGVDLQDQSLAFGQEDVFDLDTAERTGRTLRTAMDDSDDDSDAARPGAARSGADDSSDEDDRLDAELDGLYDAYREKLADRDAKYRAKEARRKNKDREEAWGGIAQAPSDEDASDAEMSEEGGWDVVQRHKRRLESDDSDSDDAGSDSEVEADAPREKKRRRKDAVAPPAKKGKLLTKLDAKPKTSTTRAAQLWFSKDVFAGVNDDLDALEAEEDVEMDEPPRDRAGSDGWEDDVSVTSGYSGAC